MSTVAVKNTEIRGVKSTMYGYVCPNESVSVWRRFIKGRRIERAAGIASGGEIGLFSLLPTVRKELVLVDHSAASLHNAVTKYLLLRTFGWKEALRLISVGTMTEINKALKIIHKDLPPELNQGFVNGSLKSVLRPRKYFSDSEGQSLRNYWKNVPNRDARRVVSKLDKVTFVLGDLRTLEGPFDLFYVSNAWEAGNGNSKDLGINAIAKLMKPGGLILATCRTYNTIHGIGAEGLTLLEHEIATGGLYMSWDHRLYQVNKEAETVAA